IRSGTVVFRPIPASRWDHSRFYDPTTRVPDKAYIDKGAFLTDEELREFASLHYGIAPRRIQVTDPQHRLLLDCVSSALQDAGYERRPRERGWGVPEPAAGQPGVLQPHRGTVPPW